MKVSIFVSFHDPIDSIALFGELEPFRLNVTDLIDKVVSYGDIEDYQVSDVMAIMFKYGANNISVTNPSI